MKMKPLFVLAAACLLPAGALAQASQPETNMPKPAEVKPDDKAAKPAEPVSNSDAEKKEALAYVLFTTTEGDILLELNREKAPISVENFLGYVESGHYDGTIFHRVIKTFMIQGGGYDKDGKEKATKNPIKNEWKNGLKNVKGSIAMARTSAHDSATSQFFINTADNAPLDLPRDGAAYAVFGKVVMGMETVEKIASGEVVSKGSREVSTPVNPVVVTKAAVMTKAQADEKMKK